MLGVENVAGTGISVLDCALSVNKIQDLLVIPEDVCWVIEQLRKLQQEDGVHLRYLLKPTCRLVQLL